MIYRLTVSTDSSLTMAEIRCLSDHQDRIRALINVNGPSARIHLQKSEQVPSDDEILIRYTHIHIVPRWAVCQWLPRRRADLVGRTRLEHPGL